LIKHAIDILERQNSERPFCIYIPMFTPHPPYGSPTGFQHMYSPSQITNLRTMNLKKRPSYFEGIRRNYDLTSQPLSTFQQVRAQYYGAVSYSDWMLGQLLSAVDRTGHTDDTAIFLLSDHGDYAGDYGLVEKWPSGLEDCLTHVPLIARMPGGRKGHTVSNMVELYDVMATCLDLAGTQAPQTNFARSLTPELRGGAGDPLRAAHTEGGYNIYEPQCFEVGYAEGTLYYPKSNLQVSDPQTISRSSMVRTRDYKLVSRPQGQSELYIYKDDPFELSNRFGDPAVASVQVEMQQRLLHWYVNTTGIAPKNKDPRDLPPFYPSRSSPTETATIAVLDEA
jgi:choline-sulfatase